MRRIGLLSCIALSGLAVAPVAAFSLGCAATPEAAILQALGNDATRKGVTGFRVREVLVDPLLHRAFVQLESCEHPERPALLLPFATGKQSSVISPVPAPAEMSQGSSLALVAAGSTVSVGLGDEHMHVSVQGRLLESAAVGSPVNVELVALGDSSAGDAITPKHAHGMLVAANRVEIRP